MHNPNTLRHADSEMDQTMPTSGLMDLDGTQDSWAAISRRANLSKPNTTTDYLALSIPNLPTADDPFSIDTAEHAEETSQDDGIHNAQDVAMAAQPPASGFSHAGDFSQSFAAPRYPHTTLFPSQVMYAASQSMMIPPAGANVIAPLDTHIDSQTPSLTNDPSFSSDGDLPSASSPTFNPYTNSIDSEPSRSHRRSSSARTSSGAPSPTSTQHSSGRRRKSENVEPGSARAIYLEKNRQAASKCRSKQKKQQEGLVETARDVERKNKALKAEVEFLKGDMRELMDIVGQHTDCPDSRLKTYVQREADKLVAGAGAGARTRSGNSLSTRGPSAKTGAPPGGT